MLNVPKIKLNNGVEIPQFGLGVFRSPVGEDTTNSVRWALEAGYRHLDTAMLYHNEQDVAKGIKQNGVKREELFITSKLANDNIESKTAEAGVQSSLEKLETSYLDLYLLHWPVTNFLDAWRVLAEHYAKGDFRAIGVSNFQIRHLEAIEKAGLPTPAVNQIELHPAFQEKELVAYCRERGIQIEAWSPLGGQDHLMINDPTVVAIAAKHGRTPAQTILRWHLQAGFIVFPKSNKKERILENANIFDFALDQDDMARFAALDANKRLYWSPDRWD